MGNPPNGGTRTLTITTKLASTHASLPVRSTDHGTITLPVNLTHYQLPIMLTIEQFKDEVTKAFPNEDWRFIEIYKGLSYHASLSDRDLDTMSVNYRQNTWNCTIKLYRYGVGETLEAAINNAVASTSRWCPTPQPLYP